MMNKNKKSPENIDIKTIGSDRVIFEPIKVEPIKKSGIIDPATGQPYDDKEENYDRYPGRGIVVGIGVDVPNKLPGLDQGDKIFIESPQACSQIVINGRGLVLTRTSNIILAYSEK